MPELRGYQLSNDELVAVVAFPKARRFELAQGENGQAGFVATPFPHQETLDSQALADKAKLSAGRPDAANFYRIASAGMEETRERLDAAKSGTAGHAGDFNGSSYALEQVASPEPVPAATVNRGFGPGGR